MILNVARLTLREARHARLPRLALLLVLAGFAGVEFIGALLVTDHDAVQAGLLGSLLRLGLVFVLGLFVVASLLREQQEHTIDLLLAIDAPRAHYALGKLLAFAAVALLLAALAGAVALVYAPPDAVLRWGLSLACELGLAAALATLLALTFSHVTAAMAAFAAVYALARGLGGIQRLLADPIVPLQGAAGAFSEGFVSLLAWLLPDLWRFSDPGWLSGGGSWADLGFVAVQTAVYAPLLVGAALFDLYRRAF